MSYRELKINGVESKIFIPDPQDTPAEIKQAQFDALYSSPVDEGIFTIKLKSSFILGEYIEHNGNPVTKIKDKDIELHCKAGDNISIRSLGINLRSGSIIHWNYHNLKNATINKLNAFGINLTVNGLPAYIEIERT